MRCRPVIFQWYRARLRQERTAFRRRAGLTLFEMLATLAILAMLTGVVLTTRQPEAQGPDDRHRAVASQLESLRRVIASIEIFGPRFSFVQHTKIGPGRLSDLTNNISSTDGAPNSKNCKGTSYNQAQEASKWNGPYWNKAIGSNGLVLERNFVAQDVLVSTRFDSVAYANGTNLGGFLAIRMLNVPLEDAQALALLVDGTTGGTVGTVRFTPLGSAPVTVDYNIVVSLC